LQSTPPTPTTTPLAPSSTANDDERDPSAFCGRHDMAPVDAADARPPPPPPPPILPPPYSIVTGANAGLGKEIARGLMARGHHVVLACRRMDACELAAEELRRDVAASPAAAAAAAAAAAEAAEASRGTCACARLDLSDFASVRAFARDQSRALAESDATGGGPPRPLILCNNAGVMGLPAPPPPPPPPPRAPSGGGAAAPAPPPPPAPLEPHLQTNHLGPYLLTRLLMPELRARPGSRVVFVASRAHYAAAAVPAVAPAAAPAAAAAAAAPRLGDGPEADWRMPWIARYSRSKLLNVQTAAGAHARLAPYGSAAFSVSPGFVATSIFDGLPAWLRGPAGAVARAVARTPAQGAAVAIYACTDEGALRGALEAVDAAAPLAARVAQASASNPWLFLHDGRPMRASAPARDAAGAEAVWRVSALLTGLESEEAEEDEAAGG